MKKILTIMTLAAMLLSLTACKGGRKKALLPTISGKAGEVVIVIGKTEWEGAPGARLRSLLADDCPFLPQQEPLYTLINIPPAAFGNLFQLHRNIILVNIGDDITNPGVVYRNDVWAQPQCVIGINAGNAETATELINENSSRILHTIEQAERNRIIENSKRYQEYSLPPVVTQLAEGSPYFPTGYSLKKRTSDFIWISYETQFVNQGIFIYRYPAKGKNPLSQENIIAKRNEFLQKNVPGMFENTYMITSDVVIPGLEYMKFKGRDFAEVRGLWEVHNDYMGGPFVSHSFYSPDGKDIIVLEGFVYAPKYDKRHYMRQVEAILYSFEWKKDE